MKRSAAALAVTVLLTACGLVPAGGGVAGEPGGAAGAPVPAGPDGELRPDLLEIDPAQAAPGDVIALRFPEQTTRGILFALDQRVDDAWVRQFFLVSDGPGPGWERDWWLAGAEGPAIPDIGVGGPGPDRVVIPDVAQPGDYRICTGNAGADFCAPIQIVAP